MPAAVLQSRPRSLANFGLRLNRRPSGGGNPAWSDQMRSIAEASVTVASKGNRLDHAICDRRRATRHQNSHGQSRSVRTPDARSQGDQTEVSKTPTEKATAEPAVPTSAKSDGNSDRPSPAP